MRGVRLTEPAAFIVAVICCNLLREGVPVIVRFNDSPG